MSDDRQVEIAILAVAAAAASSLPAPDVEAAWEALYEDPNLPEYADQVIARHRPRIEAAIMAAHDCFWDGQPPRPARPPQNIESLRMDLTDEEATAFEAALRHAPDLDVERLARALRGLPMDMSNHDLAEAIAREYAAPDTRSKP